MWRGGDLLVLGWSHTADAGSRGPEGTRKGWPCVSILFNGPQIPVFENEMSRSSWAITRTVDPNVKCLPIPVIRRLGAQAARIMQ